MGSMLIVDITHKCCNVGL